MIQLMSFRRVAYLAGLVLALVLVPAAPAFAADEPTGGAALDQIVIANLMAVGASAALLWLVLGHRSGRRPYLARAAERSEQISGLPGWCALPSALATVSLLVALTGMYWDISLHIDVGRDPGPLANPAHYLIPAGLFGIFSAGFVAVALPKGRPGATAVRITRDWYAPLGGVLIMACSFFSLLGFPLDDVWHRLFGQDVTLWGPTHLMLIGGAGLTLIGQAVLLVEGVRARPQEERHERTFVVDARRVALMGGLLIGLSTVQAEFDFGVPQFQMIFQPLLIAIAAGVALVCARVWVGAGGAVGAVAFFLAVRGLLSLIVGPILGETTPSMALYVGEAACVELAGLWLGRERPLQLGVVSGVLIGTAGFAAEYAWSQLAMPIPWNDALLPAGPLLAVAGGVAGGLAGGLMGAALLGRLPAPALARGAAAVSLLTVMALVANGLATTVPENVRASVRLTELRPAPQREVAAQVRIEPRQKAEDAKWLNITSWQGGGLVVDNLTPAGNGSYRTGEAIPVYGDWKATLRMQTGRSVLAVPVFLPKDDAIPAPEVPAPAQFQREFVSDKELLQREAKKGVSPVLTTGAPLVVLAITLGLVMALATGLARLGWPDRPPRARRGRAPALPPKPAHGTRA
jgi:hypothetical protein